MVTSSDVPTAVSDRGTDSVSADDEVTDGRLLRRRRNREAVVDALLELYRAGNLRPSTEEIAARSGLSPRSLFRYFDDVDDLTRTAITRIERQALAFVPIDVDADADLAVKARALADQRFRLFDAVGNAAAVSRLRSPFQPIIAAELQRNRAFLRAQVASLFSTELEALGSAQGAMALAAVDVLASYESYLLLSHDQQLAPAAAKAAMVDAVHRLLSPAR